ncbi:MAG: hypothetical protein ACYCSH_07870 [Acidithiobacillus sp.]
MRGKTHTAPFMPREKQSLMDACALFEEKLKAFIKNPKNGGAAHSAAPCLFEVRRLDRILRDSRGDL